MTFRLGQRVRETGRQSYRHEGEIIGFATTRLGEKLYVVEDFRGLAMIFTAEQLEEANALPPKERD